MTRMEGSIEAHASAPVAMMREEHLPGKVTGMADNRAL